MYMKIVVAPVDEFAPGTRRVVKAGSREIGVFRVADRFFAVRNRCPHQGGPLAAGRVFRRLIADVPGEVELGDSTLIACPWHGWQWDMETGEAYAPGDPRVKAYRVGVTPGAELTCAGEPFVAETFTVFVEEDYVVLEA
jgi:3-phenylpropionate/trans-cinnamate dioxygenase ferredoxin subunit